MKYKTYFTAGTLLWPLAALSGMLFCMAQAKIHYYDFVVSTFGKCSCFVG
jgi:hypothetical protein